MRKTPPLPEGWDPAQTPIMKFMSILMVIDIDGKPYEMTCVDHYCKVVDQFTKEVLYEGPEGPKGPFGIEGAFYILEIIEKKRDEAQKNKL